jgi:LmbE family N-acetylglucosaminyl deacetylase
MTDSSSNGQKTLAVVAAHADDEGPVGPILARYAREGVRVHLIIVSDGVAGVGTHGVLERPESDVQGEELVRRRAEEAHCAARALGIELPILLGFPDGKLGDYIGDRGLIHRLARRIAEELERLQPNAVITWGPDGTTGHPDHRIVSSIVTQLQRAGAPGVPERLFYMSLPTESLRALNPQRAEPSLPAPQPKYFTVRVPFTPEDLEAAERSLSCHRSQFTPDVIGRIFPAAVAAWNGSIPLIPGFLTAGGVDLFE